MFQIEELIQPEELHDRPVRSRIAKFRHGLRRLACSGLFAVVLMGVALPQSASAATGTVGWHSTSSNAGPAASCTPSVPDYINVRAPWIKAVNTTTGVDSQYVTYRPDLYRWQLASTGRYDWVRVVIGNWATPYLVNDFAGGGQIDSIYAQTFSISSGGHYRVALNYYWYPTTRVGSGSDLLWAAHQDFFESSVQYCTF